MAEYTKYYNLKKPAGSEYYNIADANTNNDLIDTVLFGKVDKKPGRDLSTNDFTDGYKNKIDTMQMLYTFKGSVETTDDLSLITNKQNGDVYRCKQDGNDYIWNGNEWVSVGQDTDFSEVMELIEELQEDVENKVDKETGKGLSTNDYTNNEKNKLQGIEAEANKTIINNTLTSDSITEALSAAQGKALKTLIDALQASISTSINNAILEDNKKKYYVGKIVMDTANVNPATYLGFGTWTLWGQGRVPVGVDTTDSDFNTVEKTGGEKKHTMTIAELVSHAHNIAAKNNNSTGLYEVKATNNTGETGDAITEYQGGGQPFNIQQKYITCYMWKRTA